VNQEYPSPSNRGLPSYQINQRKKLP
jgi:hypothetical protein